MIMALRAPKRAYDMQSDDCEEGPKIDQKEIDNQYEDIEMGGLQ